MYQIDNVSSSHRKIVETYMQLKETVISEGYEAEIAWQDEVQFSRITESDFLREASWVVLSSGMREAVIRLKFPAISEAFYFFKSAKKIVSDSKKCRVHALKAFRHRLKIDAIITIAGQIYELGFKKFRSFIQREEIAFIQTLPFMGPATSYHLAKNIGLDVVKPDRHLLRVAEVTGYDNPHDLCLYIARSTGDKISVVDLVIWRYATLYKDYLELFSSKTPRKNIIYNCR